MRLTLTTALPPCRTSWQMAEAWSWGELLRQLGFPFGVTYWPVSPQGPHSIDPAPSLPWRSARMYTWNGVARLHPANLVLGKLGIVLTDWKGRVQGQNYNTQGPPALKNSYFNAGVGCLKVSAANAACCCASISLALPTIQARLFFRRSRRTAWRCSLSSVPPTPLQEFYLEGKGIAQGNTCGLNATTVSASFAL